MFYTIKLSGRGMIRSNCYLTGIILVTIILLTVSSGAAHITYAWSLKYSYLINMSDVNNGKIIIAVTATPLIYVASLIGGDRVVVYSLVPAGVDPHHFEPSTSFLVNSLSNATIVLMTGPVSYTHLTLPTN